MRLVLLAGLVAAIAAFAPAIDSSPLEVESAQACGGTVSCCDSQPAADGVFATALGLLATEDAAACGGYGNHWNEYCTEPSVAFDMWSQYCWNPASGWHYHTWY